MLMEPRRPPALSIRQMVPEDLLPLHRLLSNEAVMRHLEPPFSMEQSTEFLRHAGLSDPPLVYAVEDDRHTWIGYAIFHNYDGDSKEIGWVLDPRFWGKGFAQHLTQLLIEAAFAEGMDAVLECAPDQDVTRHIACKMGFSPEGILDSCLVYRKERKTTLP